VLALNTKKIYFAGLIIAWLISPIIFNVNVLVTEADLIKLSSFVFAGFLILWFILFALKLTEPKELSVILLLVCFEFAYPTQSFATLGLFHNQNKLVVSGECAYISGGRKREVTITNINGFSSITVPVAIFKNNRCSVGESVSIHAFESFYGFSVSHVEVIKEKDKPSR